MQCAHVPCTCQVLEEGEFCSEPCEVGTISGTFCGCEHAVCLNNRVREPVFD